MDFLNSVFKQCLASESVFENTVLKTVFETVFFKTVFSENSVYCNPWGGVWSDKYIRPTSDNWTAGPGLLVQMAPEQHKNMGIPS